MRLITRRIHRAFRELDPYDDARCGRFIDMARLGGSAWLRRVIVGFMFLLAVAAVVGFVIVDFWGYWANGGSSARSRLVAFLVDAGVIAGLLATPFAVGLVVRDWLLRRRIRTLLRTRSKCAACGYGLLGLPVSEQFMVKCPECGHETEVDPALGELTRDETGRARFAPSAQADPPRFWTPKRLQWLKRCSLVAAILLFVVLPGAFGVRELWLARQAARARALIPGPAGLLRLAEAGQPRGTQPSDPNGWTLLEDALAKIDAVNMAVWKAAPPKTPSGSEVYPDFTYIYAPSAVPTPQGADYDRISEALARRLIEDYRAAGVYDVLREAAACKRSVRPIPPGTTRLIDMLIPSLGRVRAMERALCARMAIAQQSHDLRDYAEALEQALAVSRHASHQPSLIDRLVAVATDVMALHRVGETIRSHPSAEWLDAIESALSKQAWTVDDAAPFEAERLFVTDSIAWLYSDVSKVRWGKYSAMTQSFGSLASAKGRLGSLDENMKAMNRHFDAIQAQLAVEPWKRTLPSSTKGAQDLILQILLVPALNRSMDSFDRRRMEHDAIRAMIGLERYRLAHYGYPETLSALVPKFLAAEPIDMFCGKPLVYRTIAAEPGYILYSVGADGVDDGGTIASNATAILPGAPAAPQRSDLVFSEPAVGR